jgi:hypothetical protein
VRPQTFLSTLTQAVASNGGSGWGTLFIAAPALKGDHTKALGPIRSLAEHDTLLGGRASYSELRDQLEAFFAEGGKEAYVARLTRSPVKATIGVIDGSAGTVATVNAKSVGAWANGYQMVLTAIAGTGITSTATWTLKDAAGNTVDSIVGATAAAAIAYAWKEVDLVAGAGTGTLVAATSTLASGADGNASVDSTDLTAALPLFVKELGTGIVAAPMLDATAVAGILEAHALAYNRAWLVHSTDTPTAATIAAQGTASRAAGRIHGGILAGKVKLPALATAPTTLRTVSPVGAVAGLIARSDEKGSPARAAAGIVNGAFRYVVEATQSFSDTDLNTLHDAGVNAIRTVRGVLCLYDFITPAAQTGAGSEWLGLGQVRAHAAILAELDEIAEFYQFQLLDGPSSTILSDFHASITSMLMGFHGNKTLYGDRAADAFSVNVNGVNNAATMTARELHAAVAVKYSETNLWTYIDVTKVPISGTV